MTDVGQLYPVASGATHEVSIDSVLAKVNDMGVSGKALRLLKGSRGLARTEGAATDLSWADEFIGNVRPYIAVREEDNLLIKMPNQAYQLNAQGVAILKFLLDGGTTRQLLRRLGGDADRTADIGLFLFDIRRCLEGKL